MRGVGCISTCLGSRSSAWLESCIGSGGSFFGETAVTGCECCFGSGGSFFCETAVTGCECCFDSGNEVDRLVLVLRSGFGRHDRTNGLLGSGGGPTLSCNDCL